jgi:hypothetical protein
MKAGDSEELCEALKRAALSEDAVPGASDRYGIRYIMDFDRIRGEKRARVRSCWIIRKNESAPRFVTCFVL